MIDNEIRLKRFSVPWDKYTEQERREALQEHRQHIEKIQLKEHIYNNFLDPENVFDAIKGFFII